jgi:nitroreductase
MELVEAVRRRRMVRAFAPRPVPDQVLDEVLALALRAPSAGFTQAVDLLVLTGEPARTRFWAQASAISWRAGATEAPGLLAAPAIVLVLTDPNAYEKRYAAPDKADSGLAQLPTDSWPVPYWVVDAAFSTMLVLLGAVDAELGALFFWVRGDTTALLESFGVPPGKQTIGALAIGYPEAGAPTGSPRRRARRALSEVVHREHW